MWAKIRRWLTRLLVFVMVFPTFLILLLRWVDPPTSSVILQHNFSARLAGDTLPRHSWVDWEQISPHMATAVIASEDQRFPDHFGIDFKELGEVVESGSRRGASTITQQTAKNLFLWHGRSYVRKGIEAGLALLLELFWSKQRILEVYLNIAQTGVSIYGVELASQENFKKPAIKLNKFEAARIAAVLPNPSKYSISQPSQHVLDRQQWIIKQMKQLGGVQLVKSFN